MDTTKIDVQTPTQKLRVICGANVESVEDCMGQTPADVFKMMRGIMNLQEDHSVVLINGRQIENPAGYLLNGNEELEFKKPSGEKGQ